MNDDATPTPTQWDDLVFSNSSNYDDDYYYYYDDDYYYYYGAVDITLLALLGVAIFLSVVVIIGLLIPLFIQLKNGSFYEARNSRRPAREPIYSTYNLYLVYSSVADLSFYPLQISSQVGGGGFGVFAAILVNLWINAVVVYEVLALLRATNNARRINQPSLMKVNLQAGGVILGAVLVDVVLTYAVSTYASYLSVLLVFYCIPILFVIGVTIFVKYKNYLPPSNGTTPRDKAVRGLALFFFRVIIVFFVVWIPIMTLQFFYSYAVIIVQMVLVGLHPILNFCLILTKPDVKKYITDLVTFTYCCSCSKTTVPGANTNQGHRQRISTTVLGYTFSGADDDAGAEDGDGELADENNEDDDDNAIGSDPESGEAETNNESDGNN